MSTPAPVGPAARGARNPELAAALAAGSVPIALNPTDEHADEGLPDNDAPDMGFVRAGDIVTISVTLPVTLPGDSKEAYFGAKHTTRALPGEDDNIIYGRLAGNVIASVMASIKDTIAAVEEELTDQAAIANATRR